MQRWIKRAGRETVRAGATATAVARPLPDLVIIGVKRGGTTSLFRDLERHPAMCPLVPSARRLPLRENMKGVHYFDTNAHRSLAWYRGHFASAPSRRLHERRHGESFTAEASPYYFFHPLAASRAAAALADTQFVVMLRDPVDRTVSHWAEQTRNGVELLPLDEALAAEPDRVGDDHERLRLGDIATSHAHEQQSYAAQSMYADSLERWFDAVGRERVGVLFSERYYADPAATIAAVTRRIGVTDMPANDQPIHANAAPRPSSVDADVEAGLIERFAPDVARLEGLLGESPPWSRFGGALQAATAPADG